MHHRSLIGYLSQLDLTQLPRFVLHIQGKAASGLLTGAACCAILYLARPPHSGLAMPLVASPPRGFPFAV